MKSKHSIIKFVWLLLPAMAITLFTACGDDDMPGGGGGTDDPIASFQFAVNPNNPFEVTFTNFSQNATTYAWDFGDGNSSSDKDPVHTYAGAGDYTVTLTASNSDGQNAQRSESLSITDPNVQLGILAGDDSKTWYLLREGIALGIGPDVNANDWWSFGGITALAERPCILDDSYTFHRDGTVTHNTGGTIFVDATANGGWIINGEDVEACHDESEAGVWGDNNDREAFTGGDFTFDYDNNTNMLTVDGLGFYVGLCNKTDAGDNSVPINSKTYSVFGLSEGDVADSLNLAIVGDGFVWNFYMVSYHNPADLPDIPTDIPEFGEDLPNETPAQLFNTFASEDAADVQNLVPTESAVTLTVGVDDPADATAAKVGEYIRGMDLFSDLKFQLVYDCQFDNFTSMSVDVYFPSTNDYSGELSQQVDIFLADASQDQQFWTTWELYVDADQTALDEWVTITFDLGNALTRDDIDLIGLKIGGENHAEDGTFYVRNFRFK